MQKNNKIVKIDKGWRFRGNEIKYVTELINAGFGSGTTGSMNMRTEKAFAKRFGVKYAITSNSGTSTLHQALMALGVTQRDEVIVPALSPVMCGFAVVYTGAKPVFADVDKKTFLIDPKDIERKITKRTKVIMAVNLYGQVCDMSAIMTIAKKYNLYVLEDCAECYLGTDNKGRLGGTIGHVGSFSLQTTKHLTCGDGGILITNDEKLGERMRKFGGLGFKHIRADRNLIRKNRDLFQDPNYLRHDNLGWNYRLSELGAAVALAQVERIDWFIEKRKQMAARYLEAIGKCNWIIPQYVPKGVVNSYYTFVARYDGFEKMGVSWHDFRKKYMEFGGDGIYAAWALIYNEPIMKLMNEKGRFSADLPGQAISFKGFLKGVSCPNAEFLQPKLLQFTTNQGTVAEMNKQRDVLKKTIDYFENENSK